MGYNTVLLILNDAMGEIDRDPAGWWERTRTKIQTFDRLSQVRNIFGYGWHANGFEIAQVAHADLVTLLAVGGNFTTRVVETVNIKDHSTEEGQIQLLREWAKKMGYTLRKKPIKRVKE